MGVFSGLEHIVRDQEPLSAHTWFRLGGPAEFYAEPTTKEELAALIQRCHENGIDVRVLGSGSNVLVRDEGVKGLVIQLSAGEFSGIRCDGRSLTVGGGAKLGHVVSTAVREGLAGMEGLVGIPGTVGGALHGNAGSQGFDVGQWARGATVMSRKGELHTRKRDELRFAYRESSLDELVILDVLFELERDDPKELTKRLQKIWIVKTAAQPIVTQSQGCVFKSPGGVSAAEFIEQAGMKGARIGEAEVSDRDANFIVTGRNATAQDVLRLIEKIRTEVSDRLGVDLEMQIEVW